MSKRMEQKLDMMSTRINLLEKVLHEERESSSLGINLLKEKLSVLDKGCKSLETYNCKLERIIKHNKKDVDFESCVFGEDYMLYFGDRNKYTYIYKNSIEYKIDNLYLYKPTFDLMGNNIIKITDIKLESGNHKLVEYIVDLSTCTYIQTK